jgi:hypothetical protein
MRLSGIDETHRLLTVTARVETPLMVKVQTTFPSTLTCR